MNIYEHIKSNLALITYPNALWASHVDGLNATIAILHLNAQSTECSISVDKALTMKVHNNCLKVSTIVNDDKVTMPHAEYNVQTVHDVSNLLFALENFPPMCPVPNLLNYFPFQGSIEPLINKPHQQLQVAQPPPPPPQPPQQQQQTLTCEFCHKVSKNRGTHYKHVKTHTADHKPFVCSMCGKTFRNSYHLSEHQAMHANSKRFRCVMCNKTFSTSSNLKAHIRTHSGERRHVCNACGKAYTTSSNLQTHIRSIHQDDKPYSCDVCSMRFVHPRALRLHMLKHTKERPFKCLLCEKSFPKKVHLTVHVRSHTGEKPFVCETCGKGFASSGNLKSHLKMH